MLKIKEGLLALILLFSGCSSIQDLKSGVVIRKAKISYGPFKVEKNIPCARIQSNNKINENLDFYTRFDITYGSLDAHPLFINGSIEGNMQSFGSGINYFPFSRNLSLDLGTEIFHADTELEGNFSFIKKRLDDSILGYGLNAGITLTYQLNNNFDFFFSAGYNLTDNNSKNVHFDFDGYYFSLLFDFKIK